MIKGVAAVWLPVTDMARAVSFYGGTLTVQTVECNTMTGAGRVRFQATGRVVNEGGATAYPGTYSEQGEFVISATPVSPGSPLRTLSSFESTFTASTL